MPNTGAPPDMMPTAGYSTDFDHALALASIVHHPAERKGTRVPYIVHPLHVARILHRYGFPETVQIAGLLHDVLEDVDPADPEVRTRLLTTFPELGSDQAQPAEAFRRRLAVFIGRRFSDRVRVLVEAMTQQKYRGDGTPIPIQERRQSTVKRVSTSDDGEFVSVKAADTLHNSRSIVNDLRTHGLPMMARFKGSPGETVGYYVAIGQAVEGRLGAGHPLARELRDALHDLRTTFEQSH